MSDRALIQPAEKEPQTSPKHPQSSEESERGEVWKIRKWTGAEGGREQGTGEGLTINTLSHVGNNSLEKDNRNYNKKLDKNAARHLSNKPSQHHFPFVYLHKLSHGQPGAVFNEQLNL